MSADSQPISRRDFGFFLTCAAFTVSTSAANAQQPAPTQCYIDQSGNPGNKSFWLGNLVSENAEKNIKDVTLIRIKHKYTRVLRYRTTDKFKISFCKELIDYFVAEPTLRFHGARVSLRDWPDEAAARDVIYFGTYKRLLGISRLPTDTPIKVYLENRSFNADNSRRGFRSTSKAFIDQLEAGPRAVQAVRGFVSGYPLMQVADFFTGSLRNQTESKNKGELASYLRRKLDVAQLDEANLMDNKKFQIRNLNI